ncbi:NADH-quinone oxidoreductase subunit N [Nonomuraea sp. 3-1Str]|uniref:NADH-quinone oxidoreductase subunit N n=1 Tax=Nonomuraea sp. 3-1Str TaxID=2929801 RepID=UPI002866BC96|nr:NADH-quinone oxidoreductase subunit N [Nonomuraea sp. 3-1Str]MDR8407450.1 NADH-quinone oxidoreductase subunit N [Nonomuraea sp. 3-1Str]
MIQQIDYFVIAPPLALALAAGLVLLLDAFLPSGPRIRTALGLVTIGGVLVALGFIVAQATRAGAGVRAGGGGQGGGGGGGQGGRSMETFCVPDALAPAAAGRGSAGGSASVPALCSFVADRFTLVFAGLVLVAALVVVLMSMTELAAGGIPAGEWYFLLLCTITGAVTLPASRDLIMLVVALELVSLPVFALTALKRYDGRASEAAVKLFVVSVVSTAVMLFGVSLLYGIGGTVYLSRLAEVFSGAVPAPGAVGTGGQGAGALGAGAVTSSAAGMVTAQGMTSPTAGVITVGVVLVLAGFAFKIAAVPFHSWAPDVYQGAPVPVAALLSVISKAAGFAGLILLLVTALSGRAATWTPIVAIIAALTMTVGNLLALRQRSAVRLLAWSSVAQSGYILAPLAVAHHATERMSPAGPTSASGPATTTSPGGTTLTGVPGGEALLSGAVGASLTYLIIYAAMNLGAFAVVMLVSRGAARNELSDYRGLAYRSPVAGLALGFSLICLAGLPPGLAGLFAKVVVFRELVNGGAGWLAVIMAVNTVLGLYYYVSWTAQIFTPAPGLAVAPQLTAAPRPSASTLTSTSELTPASGGSSAPGPGSAPHLSLGRAFPAAWVAVGLAVAVAVVFSIAPQVAMDLALLSPFS